MSFEHQRTLKQIVNKNNNRKSAEQILETHLLSLINRDFSGRGYLFQYDNVPVHTAKTVEEWFAEKKIKMLANWPSLITRFKSH